MRRLIIGVMGSGSKPHQDKAFPLGKAIARAGFHLLNGGGWGVMEAVSQAFTSVPNRPGLLVGIIPGQITQQGYRSHEGYPNPYIELPIYTHLPGLNDDFSDSRNPINVLSSDILVVLPGSRGTLCELKLALAFGKPVIPFLSAGSDLPGFETTGIEAISELERVQASMMATAERLRQP